MLAAFLSTILFSISVICGHRSAKLIGGSEANFWRLTAASILLGVWSYAGGTGLGGAAFPMFLISGITGIGVGDVGLFQALPRLGSRLSLLIIQCLGAPLAALMEWCWLQTPLTKTQILCSIMILAGVGVALWPGNKARPHPNPLSPRLRHQMDAPSRGTAARNVVSQERENHLAARKHLRIGRREFLIGGAFAIMGALGNAGGAVLSRKAYAIMRENQEHISGHDAAFQRIVGGLAVAAICVLAAKMHWFRVDPRRPGAGGNLEGARQKWLGVWPWVLANSLAGQTLGMTCMQRALETIPTGLVLSITATTPIVVMPLAYVFEHEKPTRYSLIGGIIAVTGVIALVRA